jgi:hypothetical protein
MSTTRFRVSSLDDVGDADAPEGSRAWCVYFAFQVKQSRQQIESEAKDLVRMVGYLEEHKAWTVLGYASESLMLDRECDLSMDELDRLRQAGPGATVGAVLGTHGGDRRSEAAKADQGRPSTLIGRGAAYWQALLDRDFPRIAERLRAGEFRSVKAAAREAGIVRPTAMFYTDRPEDAVRAILQHFRGERLEAVIRGLSQGPPPPAASNGAPAREMVNSLLATGEDFDAEAAWSAVAAFVLQSYQSWPEDLRIVFVEYFQAMLHRLACMTPDWSAPTMEGF